MPKTRTPVNGAAFGTRRLNATGETAGLVLQVNLRLGDSRTGYLPQEEEAPLTVSDSTAQHYTLHDPDVRLMLKVRDEDDAVAFEELMLRYQDRVLTILRHLVGDRSLAEDLTQDVFLRVYRARQRYRPGAKFSTWLFTIANNVARNAKRTLSRRREVGVSPEGSGAAAASPLEHMIKEASGLMPTRQLDKAEMSQIVRLAMESLNERQRMAVLLSKFEAMSYVEIAEAMDLSVQAVKSLLSRARSSLRQVLEPYFAEGELPAANRQQHEKTEMK